MRAGAMTPALSIVIPWCDREELETTLLRHRWLDGMDVDIVVINCGGRKEPLRQIAARVPLRGLRIFEARGCRRFNKCTAINLGVSAALSNRLFLLDADVVVSRRLLAEATAALDGSSFVTVGRVRESSRSETSPLLRSQVTEIAYLVEIVGRRRRALIETSRVRFADQSRGAPGLVLLDKKHFVRVGGMNAGLRGWGWEDLDLLVRLQLVLGLKRVSVGAAIHLSHGDAKRTLHGRSRDESERDNFQRCLLNYSNGEYDGTYAADSERAGGSSLVRVA